MRRTLAAILVPMALGTFGCPRPDSGVDAARDAIPAASAVQVKLPGGGAMREVGGAPDIVSEQFAVLGEMAQFYVFTRQVTRDLNGGAAFVLLLVKAIVDYPVTSVDGDTYIWGPWTDGLNPSEWRLTVREAAVGDYEWSLEGRRKADGPGAAFESVVSGVATPGLPNRGSGTFMMDFESAERLDPAGNNAAGQITVVYDLESDPATIVMDYVLGEGAEQVSFHYEYAEVSDGSGDFQFTMHSDLDENGSLIEDAAIRTRWLASGSGRSDVRLSGGDLGDTVVTGSECWDTTFGRVYWEDSLGWQATEGDAADCAFAEALLPE